MSWYTTVSLYYAIGSITGPTISWQPNAVTGTQVFTPVRLARTCANSGAPTCTLTLAIRYVSLAMVPNGNVVNPAFSFNFYANGPIIAGEGDSICYRDQPVESDVGIAYQGGLGFPSCEKDAFPLRSTIIPSDSQGDFRIVYQYHGGSTLQLETMLMGATQTVTNPSPTPTQDTYIDSCCGFDATPYGAANYLHIEAPEPGYTFEADALVQFPSLPAGILLKNANLTFTLYQTGQGNDDIYLFEPKSSWNENSITYDRFVSSVGVLPGSGSKIPNVNLGSLVAGSQFTLDVSSQLRGVALGSWSDNGLFVGLGSSTAYAVPAVNFDSQDSGSNTSPRLSAAYVCCMGTPDVLESNEDSAGQFSAVADANYGAHVVFLDGTDGNVTYAYRPAGGSSWTFNRDIFQICNQFVGFGFPGCFVSDPTITVDYSTNDIYAFGVFTPPATFSQAPTIYMKHKSLLQNWADAPVTNAASGYYPTDLGANMASSSGTNSSWLSIIWTNSKSPYYLYFESIPIQTVWSPFASPSDPWDGYGIAPYGAYFQNLGEYVSTSTGLLSLRQTVLSLPGRGLNLDITLVYTEPYTFLNGATYNFEISPWVHLANGWQLNFPWMGTQNDPRYVHLWDGEGYVIPSSFWTGSSGTFENHQGEQFRMVRNATDIVLYAKNAESFRFDPSSHALTRIADPSGNNVTLTYQNNQISTITDAVGRTLLFCYPNNLLARIDQVTSGTCSNEALVRGVHFAYQSGFAVTDPAGRTTIYSYGGTNDTNANALIISRITYPTKWYSSYSYSTVSVGSDTLTYRIATQTVATSQGSGVKQFQYSYNNAPCGQVASSTVAAYNGTQLMGYNDYAYSFAGMSWNVSDASHHLLRGVEDLFGVGGEVIKEIILVVGTNGVIQSYTNYYQYDLWGNQIYSRKSINPLANSYQETYATYYNACVPEAFSRACSFDGFQDTFSQIQGTAADNQWWTQSGYWMVSNGEYNGTKTSGPQESTFAWSTVGLSDITVEAAVYVGRTVASSDQRFGIFAHYPGTGTSKWALVLHNRPTNGGQWLELLDEGNAWLQGAISCPIATNTWNTFVLSISGNSAVGYAIAPNFGTVCMVIGTFSSSSPAAGGAGFGLYAGGYSALFDNVTVTPASSRGDPSSFLVGPTSTIHNAPAGILSQVETVYNYTSQGLLSQTHQFYCPTNSSHCTWLNTVKTYDKYGNMASVTNARGDTTYYGYSTRYQSAYLTSENETLRTGGVLIPRFYTYNFTMGALLSSVDPNGYNTTYKYDILNRPSRITYSNGDFVSYTYNDAVNYVNSTDENGWLTQQVYDGLGRPSIVYRFLNGKLYSNETLTHNWQNRVTVAKDALGNKITYQYDSLGRTTLVTNPDLNTTSFSYNDTASWTLVTDENGVNKCSVSDRLGRLVSVVENSTPHCGAGLVTNYYYDGDGNLLKMTTSTSQSTTYSYDNIDRLTATVYPDGTTEKYGYDANDNLVQKIDRNGIQTNMTYDSLNRLTKKTYYSSPVTNDYYIYDNADNLLQVQNQNATYTILYDQRNRVTGEEYSVNGGAGGPLGGGGGGGSVAAGTLITLANRTQVPVQNLYAGVSLLSYNVTTGQYTVSTITALVTVETTNMLVIKTQDPLPLMVDNATAQKLYVKQNNGVVGWLSVTQLRVGDSLFNALDQHWTLVTSILKAPSGLHTMFDIYTSAPYNYIANGYLDPPKSPTLGPSTPSGVSQTGYSFIYTYTGEAMTRIEYSDALILTYAYDGLGRVVNVTQFGSNTPYAAISYNKNNQVTGITYGNGLTETLTYDTMSRPVSMTLNSSKKTPLALAYSYNKTGTVLAVIGQVNGASVNEQYKYDSLGRMINSTVTSNGVTAYTWFTYDAMGNRLWQGYKQSASSTWAVTQYIINSTNNELSYYQTLFSNNGNHYSYYSNGALKTQNVTTSSGTTHWTYTWNVPGNLLTASNESGVQGYYAYDGLGRRVEAKEGTSTIFYAYSGTETLADEFSAGTANDYISANGLLIARAGTYTNTVNYYHTDALGSVRLRTDSKGSTVFADGYRPYGQDNGTPSGSETYKFTGKPVSATTGLYYEYARWYDPGIGRFISQDPIRGRLANPQTLNPYVYSGNAPTTLTDPSGMSDSGGFLGWFDTYVSRPYLSWFDQSIEVPLLTFETGGNQAAVKAAVNQNAGVEVTLFDAGVVASAVAATAAIVLPYVLGTTAVSAGSTIATTGISGCTIDEQACQAGADALTNDLVDLGSTSATTEDLVSTSRFWSTTERGGFDFGDTQIHHLLPRQFGAFFERAGVENIDDYTAQLDRGVHMVLHGRGGLYVESWNPAWRLFLLNNPNADSAQILYYLKTLLEGSGF